MCTWMNLPTSLLTWVGSSVAKLICGGSESGPFSKGKLVSCKSTFHRAKEMRGFKHLPFSFSLLPLKSSASVCSLSPPPPLLTLSCCYTLFCPSSSWGRFVFLGGKKTRRNINFCPGDPPHEISLKSHIEHRRQHRLQLLWDFVLQQA